MFSYKQALDYLTSLINYEKKIDLIYSQRLFNLEKTRLILDQLGNPHLSLKTIHIAGTKGKGSTAVMLTSILDAAGYKVGLYTSPHLISPRERIRIGTHLIKEEEFSYYLAQVKSAIENIQYDGESLNPTFFEVYTVLALTYFYQKKVDIAVIEVGLGGRLDATNVIQPLIGIITPISIDHTQQLGSEITLIEREKAGIIKPNSKIIISRQEKKIIPLLKKICQDKKVSYYQVGKDIKFKLNQATPAYQKFQVEGLLQKYPTFFLPLAGENQLWNATTAVGAAEILQEFGFRITSEDIKQGLKKVSWPGRMQIISSQPIVLIDCAHNASSALFLTKFLKKFYSGRNIVLLISILKDKDIQGIAKTLCPLANQVIVTCVKSPRALPLKEIYTKIKRHCSPKPLREDKVEEALKKAKKIAGERGVVCATGSIYLVGEILSLIRNKKIN